MMKGSCLCGDVTYEVEKFSGDIANCHCRMCRKFSGSAYGVFGEVREADLRWLSGVQGICEYESSARAVRGFCRRCGSSLYYRLSKPGANFEIALGTLEDNPDQPINANIFCRYKAEWATDFGHLKSYEEGR